MKAKNRATAVLIHFLLLALAVIWLILESPDLAITEAAVGAGITTVLFFVTLKKIQRISSDREEDEEIDE